MAKKINMFKPNYIREGLKTKEEAIQRMIESLIQVPGCAGSDGVCRVFAFGQWMNIKPVKRSS